MTAMIDNKSKIMMTTTTTTTIVVRKDTPTPRVPVPFISYPSSSTNDILSPPPPPPHTHTHPMASRCLRVQTMVSLLSSKPQRTRRATRPRPQSRLKMSSVVSSSSSVLCGVWVWVRWVLSLLSVSVSSGSDGCTLIN